MIEEFEKLIDTYGKELRILYVEDNEKARISTLNILNKYFSKIDVCVDGQEGLEKYKSSSAGYHAIITDLDMPNMDGLELISKIRESNEDIYIVIFSTYNDTEYFIESINLGIDGYILKPFNIKQFFEMGIKMMNHLIQNDDPVESTPFIALYEKYKWDSNEDLLYNGEEKIKLSKNETALIKCLVENLDKITSNDELGNYIFETYDSTQSIKIRNLISKLKNKITQELIESAYGVGYKLKK
jgi:DNA-binding response OmpR family regulator